MGVSHAANGKIGYCDAVIHISSGRDTVSSHIAFPAYGNYTTNLHYALFNPYLAPANSGPVGPAAGWSIEQLTNSERKRGIWYAQSRYPRQILADGTNPRIHVSAIYFHMIDVALSSQRNF